MPIDVSATSGHLQGEHCIHLGR